MAYTNIDDPSAYFQTKTYTGTNNSNALTNDGNSDLQPDFIWIKRRNYNNGHQLLDSTRGVDKILGSELSSAETTLANRLSSFDTDGFTVESSSGAFNASGEPFVAWQWKANGGTTASNSDGNITSTVQANTDAGFSIVTYTGNGTDGATVGHGLGAVPAMVVFKCRDTSNTDWRIYHQSISPTNALSLNSAGAQYGASGVFGGTFTSTLLKVENDTGANRNTSPMIAYCFAEKQGFSQFGKYIGWGNTNGMFIYTSFQPAFVMVKISSGTTAGWYMWDTKRETFNPNNKYINAAEADAEGENSIFDIDFLSNGFKMRNTNAGLNGTGNSYIYMAFAENPFVTSTGIPTTAR